MLKLRADDITWQTIDDEIVCLDLRTSRYLLVNATGSLLWPQLVEGAELEELVDTLTRAFGLDQDTARRDATAFTELLGGRGLLQAR